MSMEYTLLGQRSRQHGFTLVEIMVALVLGLIVLGAALALFSTNQATYRANEGQNRVQENLRTAYELISRDIRSAGSTACSSASRVDTSANAYSNSFVQTPITGGTGTFSVISSADSNYQVASATSGSVTFVPAQVPDARDIFQVDDWVIVCNQKKTFLVQATGVTATTLSFATLPGAYDLDDEPYFNTPNAVVIARLRDVRWYTAPNGRGGNSLFVSRFGQAGEEVVEGVSNFGVQYLESGDTAYKNTMTDWKRAKAARISLTLTGSDVDGRALSRTSTNVVSVRRPSVP